MKLHAARAIASDIVLLLSVACNDIYVAGSIRRGKAEVKDIEIVALPHAGSDGLFGEGTPLVTLEEVLEREIADNTLRFDPTVKRNGAKYKRLLHVETGVAVDLFIAEEGNLGNILAIRTGDFEFSKIMMFAARRKQLVQAQGFLYRINGEKILCRTEEDYFEALGWPCVAPSERNKDTAERLYRKGGN